MEQIMDIASIGLRVSIVLFITGIILTVLCIWKLNIRNIYLIRSGKARRKTVNRMQELNNMTGKLRDDMDLDYVTGSLKLESRKPGKTEEQDDLNGTPFKRGEHSGNTGAFSAEKPVAMPEAQQNALRASDYKKETMDTDVLSTTQETTVLNEVKYEQNDDEGESITEVLAEPRVPINILSKELIIHTNEIIEI